MHLTYRQRKFNAIGIKLNPKSNISFKSNNYWARPTLKNTLVAVEWRYETDLANKKEDLLFLCIVKILLDSIDVEFYGHLYLMSNRTSGFIII